MRSTTLTRHSALVGRMLDKNPTLASSPCPFLGFLVSYPLQSLKFQSHNSTHIRMRSNNTTISSTTFFGLPTTKSYTSGLSSLTGPGKISQNEISHQFRYPSFPIFAASARRGIFTINIEERRRRKKK